MSQTLLLPRWLLTMKPGEDTLEHHALLIDGERIAAIGPRDELIAQHPQAARVELPEQILIPGLINGHAHSAMTLLRGVADDKKAALIPPGVFEAWADATWATDPAAAANGNRLRAPNGVVQDVNDYWMAGKPLYDPSLITVPTLLIHAEWDADLPSYQAQGYFARLVNTPYKRFVELGEGTHTVMLEKNRMQFFHEIRDFLKETAPQALH